MMELRFLLLTGLYLMAAGCAPQPDQGKPMPPHVSQWAREVHQELNHYRRQQGRPILQYHQGLERLCLDHSEWLRKKRGSSFHHGSEVSHAGSHYRARVSRIEYGMEAWGENVAYISNTPKDPASKLITMWKSSPPHHKAMLGNWTHAGNAIAVDEDGAIFATMNFARKR